MRLAGTRLKHHPSREGLTVDTKAGPVWTGEVRFNDKVLLDPLRWRRPRKIFVCAHGDLFHEMCPTSGSTGVRGHGARAAACPPGADQAARADAEYLTLDNGTYIGQIGAALCLDPYRIRQAAELLASGQLAPPQRLARRQRRGSERADERIPILLDTPAAVRWLSCEPLLGPLNIANIDLGRSQHLPIDRSSSRMIARKMDCDVLRCGRIDWVVAGGESGPGARPMHPDWARSLRDQCAAAGVPFLFKQWGAYSPAHAAGIGGITFAEGSEPQGNIAWPDGTVGYGCAEDHGGAGQQLTLWHHKRNAGRLLDGVQHDGFQHEHPRADQPTAGARAARAGPRPCARPGRGRCRGWLAKQDATGRQAAA
jgi:protein gp37